MEEKGDMSRREFSVAYNGSGRIADHSIDVDLLAPALLAFGKLIREANKEVNGKSTRANVMVVSDFEHKCFNVNFEVAVTLLEQVRSLIGIQEVKDAKDILEWLDLVGGLIGGAASTLGFLGFLKWRKGRNLESITEIKDSDQSGMVTVKVEGDNNTVNINKNTLNLSNNPKALAAVRDAFSPIGVDGFDRIELREGDEIIGEIDEEEISNIFASCAAGIEESKDITPDIDISSAWLTVYSPVYEESVDKWRFKLGKEVIYVDISDTQIAHDALERGGALADDTYQVRLEIETPKTSDGKDKKPNYKVLDVLRFIPASPELQRTFDLKKDR